MSIKQEVNKQITKINRICLSIYNNTNHNWREARVAAEELVIYNLILSKLKVVGKGEEDVERY